MVAHRVAGAPLDFAALRSELSVLGDFARQLLDDAADAAASVVPAAVADDPVLLVQAHRRADRAAQGDAITLACVPHRVVGEVHHGLAEPLAICLDQSQGHRVEAPLAVAELPLTIVP